MDDLLKVRVRQFKNGPVISGVKTLYIWSDFHFHDESIIQISNRKFWEQSKVVKGFMIPDPDLQDKYILDKLESLDDNSILLNLGDIGKIRNPKEEEFILKMNRKLHKKHIKHFLILGNHDWLSENLIYNTAKGNEKEFYKKLGFDEVFLTPIMINIKDVEAKKNKPVVFSHKPITLSVLNAFEKILKDSSDEDKIVSCKNIHGHWHSYDSPGTSRKSACLDVCDEPLKIDLSENASYPIIITGLTSEDAFEDDPWL